MKHRKHYQVILVGLLALCVQPVRSQTIPAFKNGDKIAFVGNSITDGGHYHSYIWLYYMTHFPNVRITCFNTGIGGDALPQILARFDDDVLSRKPNILTLTWGMNDTGYFEWFKPDAADYAKRSVDSARARYAVLDAKLKAHPEIKKIFILGSPYDATTKSNKNGYYPGKAEAFTKIIDFQQSTAKSNNWPYVDFYHPMLQINAREQAKDSLFSLAPNGRVHPDNDGHLVMASLFLQAQGFKGKPVADIAVNAASGSLVKAENCSITAITHNAGRLDFNYLANSLPFPLDTIPHGPFQFRKQSDGLKIIPFMDDFDKEMLAVAGLKEGNYSVLIDGEKIGTWDAATLKAGINLAALHNTPEYRQAQSIMEMNEERWEIERRLRMYAFISYDLLLQKKMLHADNAAAMDTVLKSAKNNPFIGGNLDAYSKAQFPNVRAAWVKEEEALVDEIYASNKPQMHKISIVKAD